MHQPTQSHWTTLRFLLRYLKGTIHFRLQFHRSIDLQVSAYSYVDWARNTNDCTSTSTYVIFLGSNLISWGSKKECDVARSSTKAEYRALATTTSKIAWLLGLFKELGIPKTHPPKILLWQHRRHEAKCQSHASQWHETHCNWFSFCPILHEQRTSESQSYFRAWSIRGCSHQTSHPVLVSQFTIEGWLCWQHHHLARAYRSQRRSFRITPLDSNSCIIYGM